VYQNLILRQIQLTSSYPRPVDDDLITEKSLLVNFSGFLLDTIDGPLDRVFIYTDNISGAQIFVQPKAYPLGSRAESEKQERNCAVTHASVLVNGQCPFAALVSNCKVEGGIIFARLFCSVVLNFLARKEDPLPLAQLRAIVFKDQWKKLHLRDLAIVSGRLVPNQVWCVG
jgi:hypothetical protein